MSVGVDNNGEIQIVLKVNDDGSVVVKRFGEEAVKSLDQAGKASDALGLKTIALGTLIGEKMGDMINMFAKWAVEAVSSGIEAADAASKTAEKLGMTVEEVTALQYAAKLSNLSVQDLTLAMKGMSVSAIESTDKTSAAHAAYTTLGVKAVTATGQVRPMRDLLLDLATKFAGMENGIQKTALAQDVFGRSSQGLIPFLNQGAAGINNLMAEAKRLGVVISTETSEQSRLLKDNLDALRASSQATAISFATEMAPSLLRISNATREALIESGPLMAAWVAFGGVVAESLGLGLKEPIEKVRSLKSELGDLTDKQREYAAQLAKGGDTKILEGWIKGNDAKIAGIKAQIAALNEQIAAEVKAATARATGDDNYKQKQKDIQASKEFVDALKREADTFGMAKAQVIAYDAAKLAAKFGPGSKEEVNGLLAQAAALAKVIEAHAAYKIQMDALTAANAALNKGQDAALQAVENEIGAMDADSRAWDKSNDERRTAQLLYAVMVSGLGMEADAYARLEARLNAAAGRQAHFNELRAASIKREAGLDSLEAEIAAIQLDTVTLRLNNDQRERAQILQKLSSQGINVLSEPQASPLMDEYDAAVEARRLERAKKQTADNKKELDQRVADLIVSLASEQDQENLNYAKKQADLDNAHGQALISDQSYYSASEALNKQHATNLQSIESKSHNNRTQLAYQAASARAGNERVFGQMTLNDAAFFADTLGGMMASKSRAAFEIGKAGAIAGAIIDTYKAATGAYAALASIPIVGPALGAAAAAAAIVAGIAHVQQIKSTQFGTTSAGAPISSGGASLPVFNTDTTGNVIAEPPQPPQVAAAAPKRELNITLVGDTFDAVMMRDKFVPLLNEAYADGVTILKLNVVRS